MISFLNPEELDRILEKTNRPVLVACLSMESGFQKQKAALDNIRRLFGEALSVYLLDAEHIDFAGNRFGIRGTPTYIMFHNGGRKDRIMGRMEEDDILAFVYDSLCGFGWKGYSESADRQQAHRGERTVVAKSVVKKSGQRRRNEESIAFGGHRGDGAVTFTHSTNH